MKWSIVTLKMFLGGFHEEFIFDPLRARYVKLRANDRL